MCNVVLDRAGEEYKMWFGNSYIGAISNSPFHEEKRIDETEESGEEQPV